MRVHPYLNFAGTCEEAFKFYEKCLDGKIEFSMTYGNTPAGEHSGPAFHDKILHIRLSVGQDVILGSDVTPDRFKTCQGFGVALVFDSLPKAEQVFNALSEKATIDMPFGETFWAAGFGALTDKYGIHWMVNCEQK